MKEVIEQHITQAPYRPKEGERINNKHFLQTGSTYGRFIFTDRPPSVEVLVNDVHITNCEFIGFPLSH